MNRINRRDFLKWAGVATGGLAISSVPGLRSSNLLGATEEPEFKLLVTPEGVVEVLTKTGLSLGTFSLDALSKPKVSIGLLDAGKENVNRTSADISRLVLGLPEPLIPLALHPLTAFQSLESGYHLDILVVPNTKLGQTITEVAPNRVEPDWDFKTRIGPYFIRVGIEKHFLGSCIRRDVWHAGALVRDVPSNTMLFDLHIASWWEGWRPCFAVYESKTRFCWNTCQYPAWDAIVAIVYAAIAAGIVWWLAWPAAGAIATGAVGALTVIPGVPPPP